MRTLPHPRHPPAHWARLAREAAAVIAEVPVYRGRTPPPAGEDARVLSAWLASLPTVGKSDLRRGFPKALVRASQDLKRAMAAGEVELISTSGTTENRLQVIWETAWWDPQEREAMRTNARVAEAMAGEYREAVLTTPVCGGSTCHIGNLPVAERTIDGMLFLNQVADPTHWNEAELERMVSEWNALRPVGVEADPAYLAALCRHVAKTGGRLHCPSYVQLTYELTTRGQRRAISRVLDAPLYDLYGATEAGVLFMQCADGRLHHNARHSHIELLDVDPSGRLGRVIVTTLGRPWMPLLRYDVGDVVRLFDGPCACGRDDGGYLLARVEGRVSDCVETGRGLVTPAMLDDAIDAAAPAVEAWQLTGGPGGYTLRVVGGDENAAADAVSALLDARVTAARESAILPEGSGKYRLVKAQAA